MVRSPSKVFTPHKVKAPLPDFVNAPVPEITLAKVESLLFLISKSSFNAIAAAEISVPINVELADTVVVPEYDCVPVVVTLAPMFDVPDTEILVTPEIAPTKSKFPVTVKAFDPPVTAFKVTVEAVKVLSPPDNVVVP